MKDILNNSRVAKIVREGIKVAIVGKPNVGKSSLLNMLLDEDKAIVSSIEGTTRDMVEGELSLNNVTLRFIDTAGIRNSDDFVEQIGIKRSIKAMNEADIVFVVLDSSRPLDDYDYKIFRGNKG
ncbi:MAG: 50S ribosome-binding GTPase [Clostridium sp.]|nr:MAG: 50S ribosome-binding GTPase [Clostridium sp.]